MPSPETAARGRTLLAERVRAAPEIVAALPPRFEALEAVPRDLPRCLVTTGIGTSEGHARHLAEVAARFCGQPARFASTGSLAGGSPPGARADWLVVFSQGLSPNARHALAHVDDWGGVILVTGLSDATSEEQGLDPEKRIWLEHLDRRGVVRLDLGCGTEYGALLRVIGARAGYVVAWSLLRTLTARALGDATSLELEPSALIRAQHGAMLESARAFPTHTPLAPFFDAARSLLLVAEGGALEMVDQLTLKLAEGMLRPQPRAVDVLQFAHGPLQSLALRPTSILYLAPRDPGPTSEAWLSRFRSTLDPALHDLRVLRAELPWPFAAVEYEALFDDLVLRVLAETEGDLVDWPGVDREAALYSAGPNRTASVSAAPSAPRAARRLEEGVWPEIENLIAEGRRTALIGLGSIEQHGPHLPLGTDRWIANALLEGLADRLEDAIALPAVAIGCAREHLDFPGTLHVEPETLEAILRDLLRSVAHHGFERVFLFTAHGGNVDALGEMGRRLEEAAKPLALRIETDLRVGAMQSSIVEAESLSPLAAGPHAGEYETSLVAMLRPGSIRTNGLVPGRIVEPGQAQALFYPSLRPNTESGVLGDPSAASSIRGERYLEAWLDLLEGAYHVAFTEGAEKKRQ
jgi:creatinine amidohydrolase